MIIVKLLRFSTYLVCSLLRGSLIFHLLANLKLRRRTMIFEKLVCTIFENFPSDQVLILYLIEVSVSWKHTRYFSFFLHIHYTEGFLGKYCSLQVFFNMLLKKERLLSSQSHLMPNENPLCGGIFFGISNIIIIRVIIFYKFWISPPYFVLYRWLCQLNLNEDCVKLLQI